MVAFPVISHCYKPIGHLIAVDVWWHSVELKCCFLLLSRMPPSLDFPRTFMLSVFHASTSFLSAGGSQAGMHLFLGGLSCFQIYLCPGDSQVRISHLPSHSHSRLHSSIWPLKYRIGCQLLGISTCRSPRRTHFPAAPSATRPASPLSSPREQQARETTTQKLPTFPFSSPVIRRGALCIRLLSDVWDKSPSLPLLPNLHGSLVLNSAA